jgi:hypothetical protein
MAARASGRARPAARTEGVARRPTGARRARLMVGELAQVPLLA